MNEWSAALRRAQLPGAKPEPRRVRRVNGRVPHELREDYRPFPWPTRFVPRFDLGEKRRAGTPCSDFNGNIDLRKRSDQDWAEVFGVDRTQLYRWIKRGLTYWQADHVAAALGLHPALIWHDWWEVTETIVGMETG